MADRWHQLYLDWEKRGRNAAQLAGHLRLCGLPEASRKLVLAIFENGLAVEGANTPRVQIEASQRRLAKLAGISAGTVSKVAARLAGGEMPVLRYGGGLYIISLARLWGLPIRKPSPLAIEKWGPAPDPPPEPAALPRASARFRPHQDQEGSFRTTQDPRNQNQAQGPVLAQDLVEALLAGGIEEQHAGQVERLGRRIIDRLAPFEARAGVESEDRLKPPMARRIAEGIACDDAEALDELESIFGWIERQASFDRSPAACLVSCAARRGWIRKQRENR